LKAVVLTYHSHRVLGPGYDANDHVALAADLETVHRAGARIVPLREIAEGVGRPAGDGTVRVGISFDDGPVFDAEDFEHPVHGPQRGFLNILRDFRDRHDAQAQPGLHATSFVIASPEARSAMERAEDSGYRFIDNWLGEHWWRPAAASGLMEIGNHSWDHVHHSVARTAIVSHVRNDFAQVKTYPDCEREIRMAAEYIRERAGACALFAYPFGHISDYLEHYYLPVHQQRHGMIGAFGTGGRAVTAATKRWKIPRFVCGEHWRSPAQLERLLQR
jgi:hypothetical protein